MANRLADEHKEQVAVMEWAEWQAGRHPALDLLHAVPNGGHRHPATAKKLQAEGVKRGVPDLCLPSPRGGYCGLYIELKVPGGRENPDQKWWRDRLVEQGYYATVCVGADAAILELTLYLDAPHCLPACCFDRSVQPGRETETANNA